MGLAFIAEGACSLVSAVAWVVDGEAGSELGSAEHAASRSGIAAKSVRNVPGEGLRWLDPPVGASGLVLVEVSLWCMNLTSLWRATVATAVSCFIPINNHSGSQTHTNDAE